MRLRGVQPDLILASCSQRTQDTATRLAEKLEFDGPMYYLQELYLTRTEILKETLLMQEKNFETIFVIGHNPQMTDFANLLTDEHISKIPAMGVVAINFDIDEWSELEKTRGEIDFFIHPKQFKYYMPKQIRSTLGSL